MLRDLCWGRTWASRWNTSSRRGGSPEIMAKAITSGTVVQSVLCSITVKCIHLDANSGTDNVRSVLYDCSVLGGLG